MQQLPPLRDLSLTILKVDKARKEQAAVAGEQNISWAVLRPCVSREIARGLSPCLFKVKSGGSNSHAGYPMPTSCWRTRQAWCALQLDLKPLLSNYEAGEELITNISIMNDLQFLFFFSFQNENILISLEVCLKNGARLVFF